MSDPSLGSDARPLRVAVIGSGPSAFYATEALFKVDGLHVGVDMFDRLPTPYGLVRGGVAPDHQKIKNVIRVYEKIAADPAFRFFGNVKLGRDLSVADLRAHYDHIVYAVGNESDRKMGIDGEELGGVHSATEFVGWYNGHPDFRDCEFDLENAERVAVVGNGNVAMDVTRVLAKGPDQLAETDIADYALEKLRESNVKEIVLLGRRGPAQAAFSPKEIKEVGELDSCDLVVIKEDTVLDELSATWLEEKAERSAKRNVDYLKEMAEAGEGDKQKKVRCRFLVSPIELQGEDGRVKRMRVQHSELYEDDRGTPRPRGIDRYEDLDCQLVFKAIGYRGVPIDGVPFDEGWGTIPNDDGRVTESRGGTVVPNEYVVGWAKRGPTGLIGTNSPDSKATVEKMIEDVRGKIGPALPDGDAIGSLLRERSVDFVSYADWRALDAWEKERGAAAGKVREKLSSIDDMMRVIGELRAKG